MLDPKIFKMIMDRDFISMSPLELRPFMWASLQAYDSPYVRARMQEYNSKFDLIHWMSFWTEKERVVSPFDGKEEASATVILVLYTSKSELNVVDAVSKSEALVKGIEVTELLMPVDNVVAE